MSTAQSDQEVSIDIPDEIRKFNWGAFINPGLWSIVYGTKGLMFSVFGIIILSRFIDTMAKIGDSDVSVIFSSISWILILGVSIYVGKYGNINEWKKGKKDIKSFKKSQKTFLIVAIIVMILIFAFSFLGSLWYMLNPQSF